MIVFRWRCWLRALWYALTNPPSLRGPFAGAFVSGCDYRVHVPDDVTASEPLGEFLAYVQILRCDDCGGTSFGWRPA